MGWDGIAFNNQQHTTETLFDCASPDFTIALVNVPQAPLSLGSRCAHFKATTGLGNAIGLDWMSMGMFALKPPIPVELVKASSDGFDGILVNSIFDVGVDVARESVAKVVSGCFYPAVSQALLLTNGTAFSIVRSCC